MPRYRYEDYVMQFKLGDILTRQFLADMFGVGRATAKYHLERAVEAGLLRKQYGWCGKQSGWLYATPETMKQLPGTQQ